MATKNKKPLDTYYQLDSVCKSLYKGIQMRKIANLLMSFLMLTVIFGFVQEAHSKEIIRDGTMATVVEKEAVVNWIINKTNNRASENYARRVVESVYKNSQETGVDPLIIIGMITKESMFKQNAKSFYGAQGLMQVVPRWHRKALNGRSAFHVETNIEVGTAYIKYCFENRKTFNGAMGCYSGGAKNYASFVKQKHKELKQVIVLALFESNQNINLAYNTNKPIQQSTFTVAGL